MSVKAAIETGGVDALRNLLAEDPARANRLIDWGKNLEIHTHPLHYVSDMISRRSLPPGTEIPLIDVLLEGGADCNHSADNGETPLIGAASLGAEEVALRLLAAGARPNARGAFNETALHWAALMGLERLVAALIEHGADVDVADARYNSPPLGWAIHGRFNTAAGNDGRHSEVVAKLIAAGAKTDPRWLADEKVRSDPRLLAALTVGR